MLSTSVMVLLQVPSHAVSHTAGFGTSALKTKRIPDPRCLQLIVGQKSAALQPICN